MQHSGKKPFRTTLSLDELEQASGGIAASMVMVRAGARPQEAADLLRRTQQQGDGGHDFLDGIHLPPGIGAELGGLIRGLFSGSPHSPSAPRPRSTSTAPRPIDEAGLARAGGHSPAPAAPSGYEPPPYEGPSGPSEPPAARTAPHAPAHGPTGPSEEALPLPPPPAPPPEPYGPPAPTRTATATPGSEPYGPPAPSGELYGPPAPGAEPYGPPAPSGAPGTSSLLGSGWDDEPPTQPSPGTIPPPTPSPEPTPWAGEGYWPDVSPTGPSAAPAASWTQADAGSPYEGGGYAGGDYDGAFGPWA